MQNAMRKIYILLIASGLMQSLFAQQVLQSDSNAPREGDNLIKQSVPYRPSGSSGSNVIWNFSDSTVVDTDYPVEYFSREDESGLIGAEPGKLLHYRLSNDSLLMEGYESPNVLVKYSWAGLLLKFPITYGDSLQSAFSGRGRHNDRIESLIHGSLKTVADGCGVIQLPNNETLENIIRVHTHKEETSRYAPVSSLFDIFKLVSNLEWNDTLHYSKPHTVITDIYQWYESGYRYPVFETVESSRVLQDSLIALQKSSFFYHPYDQTADTGEEPIVADSLQTAENEMIDPWADLTCHLTPNPAKSTVNVEMYLPQTAEIRMQIHTTQGFVYTNENFGFYPEGEHKIQLNVSDLPIDNYVLDLWLNEHLVSLVLMKR
ncbi:hypothetical protein FACS189413_09950 [Bacteroidia bacterium]|nr:hypothetical protein FACS189413_09950 [Bacteroidia bacterium]